LDDASAPARQATRHGTARHGTGETGGGLRQYGAHTIHYPRRPHPVPAATRRVALFLLAYLLILLAASLPKGMAPPPLADVVWGSVASLALVALTYAMLTREGRTWRDVGLNGDRRTLARLTGGAAIGAVVYATTLGVLSLGLGPLVFSAAAWPQATGWLRVVTSFLALACMEELGFRAYALRTLTGALGPHVAQVVIAVAFGLSHRLFGWGWLPIAVGVIPSALLFGALAIRSGGLAMPIGVHAALNVAQWMVGEKDHPGIWTLDVAPAHAARMTTFAPYIGLSVTLLAALVVARWPTRTQARADG
jgi:membrane protease YdiL (CAAX protease family)